MCNSLYHPIYNPIKYVFPIVPKTPKKSRKSGHFGGALGEAGLRPTAKLFMAPGEGNPQGKSWENPWENMGKTWGKSWKIIEMEDLRGKRQPSFSFCRDNLRLCLS